MISKDREYRTFTFAPVTRSEDGSEPSFLVEGYAAVFDQSTVLCSFGGVDHSEKIARGAFSGCEMSDVVMNFDHMGKPVARTKNRTLSLVVDERGLKVSADLSGTEEARKLYEEIKGGYIDKMSFAFVVAEDSYDRDTHERTITRFKRLYDVAAVTFPAYDATDIAARSYFEAEAKKAEEAEARAAAAEAERITKQKQKQKRKAEIIAYL